MDSLFPYSSVVGLVEKCLSDGGGDSSVLSSLSALLRHVPYRPDLFSIYASLSASNKLKLKLASYQLAIRNRDDEQLILLFNQALKDLSHSCWNISMLALQFLFIPAFEDVDEKFDKTVLEESTLSFIKDSSTRRAALSALGYLEDWSRWRDVICRTVCGTGDLMSCVRLLQVTLPFPSACSHSSNILSRLTNQLSELDGFDLTTSVIILDLLDIANRNRGQIEQLDSFSAFLNFLTNLESSTQISTRLYFSILKFGHVTKLTNEDTFCYHVMRQTDQQSDIAQILVNLASPLTGRIGQLLVNTESCEVHVTLIKYHRDLLTRDHFTQMWETLKFELISADKNSKLSANQLAVAIISTVQNFSDGFLFFTTLAENWYHGNYFSAILRTCPNHFDQISKFLTNQNLSRDNQSDHELISQSRNKKQNMKFDQLSPQVAEILQNSNLQKYWSD